MSYASYLKFYSMYCANLLNGFGICKYDAKGSFNNASIAAKRARPEGTLLPSEATKRNTPLRRYEALQTLMVAILVGGRGLRAICCKYGRENGQNGIFCDHTC